MEKVIDIKKDAPIDAEIERYGEYARTCCNVLIQNGEKETFKKVFIDQKEIIEYINKYLSFLDEEKRNKYQEYRESRADKRREKNMKYIWLYTLAFVGAILSWIATSPIGIPLFIGFFIAGVMVALVVNDVFKHPEDIPEIKEIGEQASFAYSLLEEAKTAIKNYDSYDIERIRIDGNLRKKGIPTLEEMKNPKRCEMLRKHASFWETSKRHLAISSENVFKRIREMANRTDFNNYEDNNMAIENSIIRR